MSLFAFVTSVLLLTQATTSWSMVYLDNEGSSSTPTYGPIHDRAAHWISEAESRLTPLARAQGGDLKIVVDWTSNRTNSEAKKDNNQNLIIVYAGLVGHSKMDRATLELIICHEMGHHFGGEPFASRGGWSSVEGQADYYSTQDCYKELGYSESEALSAMENLATFYANMTGAYSLPSLSHKDPTQAPRIHYGYPTPQCRLDSMLAGWYREERPGCWFKK